METPLKTLFSSYSGRITIAFCGVVLPLVGILVETLRYFGVIFLNSEAALDLTQSGKFWVHPERDIPVYIFTTGIILIIILLFPWQKLKSIENTKISKLKFSIIIFSFAGISLFAFPTLAWRTPKDATHLNYPYFWIYGITSLINSAISAYLTLKNIDINVQGPQPQIKYKNTFNFPNLIPIDILIFFLIGIFVFVPDTKLLAGRFFQIEEFYHWNAYAVSAALALLKGGVLYGNFIPQYGVGWPLLFAFIHPFYSLSYDHVLTVAMLVAIAYFYSVFFFFRTLGFCRILCFSATLLAVAVLILPAGEPETKSIIWRWGGGIPMRSPLDMVFFALLLCHISNPKKRSASLLGAICGLNLLFSIDAGFFLATTMVATWFFWILFTNDRRVVWSAIYSCATAFGVLVTGLLFATRGELFSQRVVKNIVEHVARPASEGLLPFAGLEVLWVCAFCFITTLLFYSVAQALATSRESRGAIEVAAWSLGVYGLQRMVYFMGRTTWSNLLVMVVPVTASIFIIATNLKYRNSKLTIKTDTQIGGLEQWISAAFLFSAALVIAVSRDTKNYPAFWNASARKELAASGVSFPRQSQFGVSGLPDPYFPYVQSMLVSAQRMRDLRSEGQSVCVLDPCATTLYLLAGVSPYGNMFDEFAAAGASKKEVFEFARQISEKGPDIVVLNKAKFPWPRVLASDTWQICRDELFSKYRRTEEYGWFEIWHRNRAEKR